jgi:hypothetical protein
MKTSRASELKMIPDHDIPKGIYITIGAPVFVRQANLIRSKKNKPLLRVGR